MLTKAGSPMKICRDCGDDRPIEEFRLRSKTDTKRHAICDACHRRRMRIFHARRRGHDLNHSLGMISSGKLKPTTVDIILNRLIRRFGSVEAFVAEWVTCARQAKVGTQAALRAYGAVAQLIAIADQQRPAEPDVTALTDEQLERELESMLVEFAEGRSLLSRGVIN